MIKNYRKIVIISLFCLIPLIYSIPIYSSIPNSIPTHWNFNGEIDGYTSKRIFVFVLPLAAFLLNIIISTFMYLDPRNKLNKAILKDIYIIIIPVFLNILYLISLLVAFNYSINIIIIIKIILGIMFIIMGNYMPKLKRNYTLGIKTPWTLNDDEIWNKTNILGGKILFIIGFIFIFSTALKNNKAFLILFISSMSLLFIPVVYSYILYLKKVSKN